MARRGLLRLFEELDKAIEGPLENGIRLCKAFQIATQSYIEPVNGLYKAVWSPLNGYARLCRAL